MDTTGSTAPAKEPKNTAALSRKERKTHRNSDTGNAGQESLAVIGRARPPERHGRSRRSKKSNAVKKMPIKEGTSTSRSTADEEEGDEKAEVENKIMALQKIVPGGESLGVDKLFEETAGYILELQYQVKALKFLASFVEGSDKEKRKFA